MNETEKTTNTNAESAPIQETKFCAECGQKIAKKAIVCPNCGCQVEKLTQEQPSIVINNSNQNSNQNNNAMVNTGRAKNKWVALLLLIFFGIVGGHKFYEGKIGMGVLYIFTLGLCGIGVFIDFWRLLFKPNPYYV